MHVNDWAQVRPENTLVLDDLQRQRDWGQFQAQLQAKLHFLRERGLQAGDRIGLLMANRVEYVEWLFAGVCAGLWVVPVNWHLQGSEIAYVIDDSGLRLLLHDEQMPPPKDAHCECWLMPEDELAYFADRNRASFSLGDPAGGIMLYTSGTTGQPKGVRRHTPSTLAELFRQWRQQGVAVGLDGRGVHLVTGPLYHAAPMLYALYDLLNGAAVLIQPRFDAEQALRLIDQYQVSHSHWVPTMFVRALRLPDRQRFQLHSLTLVLHGAAPIAREIKEQMLAWWGPVLVEYWGGSESGAVTRVNSADWLAHPGTVGQALPQFSVYAVDESGRRLPAGEEGLLAIAHHSRERCFSYHNDPGKTERAYLARGVFSLGDIGRVDEQGFVYLTDRQSHTIISGGVNIYPAEIEAALIGHPAVADIVVLGVPDDEWGERVCAVVELTEGAEPAPSLREELLARAASHLAAYKVPRELYFEPLPRTEAGKVYLQSLRERFWQGRERRI